MLPFSRGVAGVGWPDINDLERKAANTVMSGVVKAVSYGDTSKPRVRVGIGDPEDADNYILTGWIPMAAGRSDEWNPLKVGEAVQVYAEGGELQNAVAGHAIHSTDNPAPGDRADLWRKKFADGTVLEYDEGAKAFKIGGSAGATLTMTVGGSTLTVDENSIAIAAGGASITISGGKVTISGDVQISGGFEANGGAFSHNGHHVGDQHKHVEVMSGPGLSGPPQ